MNLVKLNNKKNRRTYQVVYQDFTDNRTRIKCGSNGDCIYDLLSCVGKSFNAIYVLISNRDHNYQAYALLTFKELSGHYQSAKCNALFQVMLSLCILIFLLSILKICTLYQAFVK